MVRMKALYSPGDLPGLVSPGRALEQELGFLPCSPVLPCYAFKLHFQVQLANLILLIKLPNVNNYFERNLE